VVGRDTVLLASDGELRGALKPDMPRATLLDTELDHDMELDEEAPPRACAWSEPATVTRAIEI